MSAAPLIGAQTGIWMIGPDESNNYTSCSFYSVYVSGGTEEISGTITMEVDSLDPGIVIGMKIYSTVGFDGSATILTINGNILTISAIATVQPTGTLTFVDPAGECQMILRTNGCDLCGDCGSYDYFADPCRTDNIPCSSSEFSQTTCYNYPAEHPSGITMDGSDIGGYVVCSSQWFCGNVNLWDMDHYSGIYGLNKETTHISISGITQEICEECVDINSNCGVYTT